MPIASKELDEFAAGGCQVDGCECGKHGVLFLNAKCHPGGRVEVSYRNGSSVLRVGCKECGRLVASVSVAKEKP